MSAFQPVNTDIPHSAAHHSMDVTTPTTPRAKTCPSDSNQHQPSLKREGSNSNTPTRSTFALADQRPHPSSSSASFAAPHNSTTADSSAPHSTASSTRGPLKRTDSHQSVDSPASRDVDMDDSDGADDASDGESLGGEGSKSAKKKKGQRFFCTDFPPCNLSFTRSEHLARHIRKHTGERPFQCHCSRRFSRLDNLRQHAQTVHVNEEIPNDSLAATGTRFQRQVRTDRVRPAGGPARSRASTVGSNGSIGRSHARNLSTSSIGSTVSNYSTRDLDVRRRPPPLLMATDSPSRTRLTVDTFRASPDSPAGRDPQHRPFTPQSPSMFGTPTSATFSAGPGSPRFSSAVQSPNGSMNRSSGYWSSGSRTPLRRLSVPSGTSPFQSPPGTSYPQPYMSPSSGSTFSPQSSIFASPTSSTYSGSIYEPNALAARENTYKRQTWHPESASAAQRRAAMGGLRFINSSHPSALAYSQPPPAAAPPSQETRLPGIESFIASASDIRRAPSPMQVDNTSSTAPPPPNPHRFSDQIPRPETARGPGDWGMSLHRGLTRLDLAASTPPSEQRAPPNWPLPAVQPQENLHSRPVTAPHHHQQAPPPPLSGQPYPQQQPHQLPPFQPSHHRAPPPQQQQQPPIIHQQKPQQAQTRPADPTSPTHLEPETPRKKKRQGWYAGPMQVHQFQPQPATTTTAPAVAAPSAQPQHRTSPEDSSSSEGVPTPSTSSIAEYNPGIVNSNGSWSEEGQQGNYPHINEAHQSQGRPVSEPEPSAHKPNTDMLRLQALVAVATSENKATN